MNDKTFQQEKIFKTNPLVNVNNPIKNSSFLNLLENKKIIYLGLFFFFAISTIFCILFYPYNKNKEGNLFENTIFLESGVSDDHNTNISADTDNDGLTDYEEKMYNTDINSADTDGDRYSDFVEVRSGYNPNGEGKLDKSKFAPDISFCDQEKTDESKALCLKSVAVAQKDENICKKINKDIKIEFFYLINWCYESVAKAKNDYNICFSINNQTNKDLCIYDIAKTLPTQEKCNSINDLQLKNRCVNLLNIAKEGSSACDKEINSE